MLILFDEFEKRFGEDHNTRGINNSMGIGFGMNPNSVSGFMLSHQTELLELFDGISSGKKMFVLTYNEISTINNYLIDRPGRIHYHFRFTYPTPKEIMLYARDNIDPKYEDQCRILLNYSFVQSLLKFSYLVNLDTLGEMNNYFHECHDEKMVGIIQNKLEHINLMMNWESLFDSQEHIEDY